MPYGRVFLVGASAAFVACAGVLASARASWASPASPIGPEDLSALAIAALAALATLGASVRHRSRVAYVGPGQLLRDFLDSSVLAASLLLAAWVEIVRPFGMRGGLAATGYAMVGLCLGVAIWGGVRRRKGSQRAGAGIFVPFVCAVLAGALYGVSVTTTRSVDPSTLSMAAAVLALLLVRQLLVQIDNMRLTRVLGATERELTFRADHDPLTNLPNRSLFRRHVEHALNRRRRRAHDGICTVMVVDIDDFKTVNDELGHTGADQVLVEVARRLSDSLRSADTIARLGADEFGILFEQVPAAGDLLEVAERVVDELRAPMDVGGKNLQLQATVGVALHGPAEPPADASELMRRADVALRLAKQRGRGMFGLFEASMHVAMQQPRRRRAGLEQALALREFRLYYQPIVEVQQRTIVGAEALIRWAHPEAGLLGPDEFISDLEDVGLIAEVGRWVLEEAVAQAASLRNELGVEFFVTVNVSSLQLHDPHFTETVRRALAVSGLPPSALVLELTESGSVAEDAVALGRLRALRALGARLAIDDFGTGYSSMSYLHRFPVDVLKIDKSFIADLVDDSPDRRLAEELTRLGASLGLLTIAEGVETAQQHSALRLLACPLAQGFFYGAALPKEHLAIALRAAGRPLPAVSRRTA